MDTFGSIFKFTALTNVEFNPIFQQSDGIEKTTLFLGSVLEERRELRGELGDGLTFYE